jgi:hypothetical protein
MNPQFVIDIRPHRYGWTCAVPRGDERVFILKPQAIQFAQRQCATVSAEILVRNRHGDIECRLRLDPQHTNGNSQSVVSAEFSQPTT